MIEIGSIEMQLYRKPIKNLHISVLPPDGQVRVAAPASMSDTAIRMAVINRIPGIKKQQAEFAQQSRQSAREMVSGECHYLWGKRYRLNVIYRQGMHEVMPGPGKLHLYVAENTTLENKQAVLDAFYRQELKEQIEKKLSIWQIKTGVSANDWAVKKMKTKWESCSINAKRIWLNFELVKKAIECLDYILLHELIHLLERQHNQCFVTCLDKYLPDWRERRHLLNSMPLVYNCWVY